MSIPQDLLDRARATESAQFDVVVTLIGENVPQGLEAKLTEILGYDQVYSGRLSGKEVAELAGNPNVASIEEDSEQFALDDE